MDKYLLKPNQIKLSKSMENDEENQFSTLTSISPVPVNDLDFVVPTSSIEANLLGPDSETTASSSLLDEEDQNLLLDGAGTNDDEEEFPPSIDQLQLCFQRGLIDLSCKVITCQARRFLHRYNLTYGLTDAFLIQLLNKRGYLLVYDKKNGSHQKSVLIDELESPDFQLKDWIKKEDEDTSTAYFVGNLDDFNSNYKSVHELANEINNTSSSQQEEEEAKDMHHDANSMIVDSSDNVNDHALNSDDNKPPAIDDTPPNLKLGCILSDGKSKGVAITMTNGLCLISKRLALPFHSSKLHFFTIPGVEEMYKIPESGYYYWEYYQGYFNSTTKCGYVAPSILRLNTHMLLDNGAINEESSSEDAMMVSTLRKRNKRSIPAGSSPPAPFLQYRDIVLLQILRTRCSKPRIDLVVGVPNASDGECKAERGEIHFVTKPQEVNAILSTRQCLIEELSESDRAVWIGLFNDYRIKNRVHYNKDLPIPKDTKGYYAAIQQHYSNLKSQQQASSNTQYVDLEPEDASGDDDLPSSSNSRGRKSIHKNQQNTKTQSSTSNYNNNKRKRLSSDANDSIGESASVVQPPAVVNNAISTTNKRGRKTMISKQEKFLQKPNPTSSVSTSNNNVVVVDDDNSNGVPSHTIILSSHPQQPASTVNHTVLHGPEQQKPNDNNPAAASLVPPTNSGCGDESSTIMMQVLTQQVKVLTDMIAKQQQEIMLMKNSSAPSCPSVVANDSCCVLPSPPSTTFGIHEASRSVPQQTIVLNHHGGIPTTTQSTQPITTTGLLVAPPTTTQQQQSLLHCDGSSSGGGGVYHYHQSYVESVNRILRNEAQIRYEQHLSTTTAAAISALTSCHFGRDSSSHHHGCTNNGMLAQVIAVPSPVPSTTNNTTLLPYLSSYQQYQPSAAQHNNGVVAAQSLQQHQYYANSLPYNSRY